MGPVEDGKLLYKKKEWIISWKWWQYIEEITMQASVIKQRSDNLFWWANEEIKYMSDRDWKYVRALMKSEKASLVTHLVKNLPAVQ